MLFSTDYGSAGLQTILFIKYVVVVCCVAFEQKLIIIGLKAYICSHGGLQYLSNLRSSNKPQCAFTIYDNVCLFYQVSNYVPFIICCVYVARRRKHVSYVSLCLRPAHATDPLRDRVDVAVSLCCCVRRGIRVLGHSLNCCFARLLMLLLSALHAVVVSTGVLLLCGCCCFCCCRCGCCCCFCCC